MRAKSLYICIGAFPVRVIFSSSDSHIHTSFRNSFIEILLFGESREQNNCPANIIFCINLNFRIQRHFYKCFADFFVCLCFVFVLFCFFFTFLFVFFIFMFWKGGCGGGVFCNFFTVQSVMYV